MRALTITLLVLSACDPTDGTPKTETGEVDTGDAVVDTDDTDDPDDREDADGDGYTEDCDDNNPDVHPGAAEICDGLDNDCNELVDDSAVDALAWFLDDDGDGYGDPEEETLACEAPVAHVANADDCDDADARFNPSAIESDCEDPSDYNCDGSVGYADDDNDGFAACAECDDSDADVNPDADETCTGVDDNCNGLTDDQDPLLEGGSTWYADADGDGVGTSRVTTEACEAPDAYVASSNDCDDLDASTYPGAPELCDETDNDCDGSVDEGVGFTWYADADGDGYGDAASSTTACDAPPGYSANGDDCDDSAPSAHPGGVEVCNGADDDCDGVVDGPSALNATTWYADSDSDGYGDAATSTDACSAPSGFVADGTDCNDADTGANPGATETCNGVDDNCDGTTDEASAIDATTWYADADGDGYGSSTTPQTACSAGAGYVADDTDCDDSNASANPSATEICDGIDNNCDGTTDVGLLLTWYADFDSDGYGSTTVSQEACTAPAAYVSDNTDCNDVDAAIHPGATEICDAADTDEDCDGAADDNDLEGATGTTPYYPDLDGDGYGDQSDSGTGYCDDAGALVADNSDCDDSATGGAINPGATETWYDGTDSDCDGASDYDADGDGFDSDAHGGADCNDVNASFNTSCYLYTFTSHQFTTCGTSGRTGPSLSTCQSSYTTTGDWDNSTSYLNMTVNGIQRWTVPATASYRISATGAAGKSNGNSYSGGVPATIQGDINLVQGEIINILVGQEGTSNTQHGNENGGGGGSFVVRDTGTEPLVIAGGGGGAPSHSYSSGCTRTNGNGQLGTSGKTVNCQGTGAGGTSGNGGSTTGSHQGGAGGGLTGDGADGNPHCNRPQGGDAFVNGGAGGAAQSCYGAADGGFGGGGAGELAAPGGGGGYSGGGTAGQWSSYADYGGGGGSYNAGTNQSATVSGSGNGSITITLLELN